MHLYLLVCPLVLLGSAWSNVVAEAQYPLAEPERAVDTDTAISFSQEWQVIGPFQIGTREAPWGVDPLEQYGGIAALDNDTSRLRSSLTPNATVQWKVFEASASSSTAGPISATVDLRVDFENVLWEPMTKPYGWAALQWQGWARGSLVIDGKPGPRRVALYTDGVLEFNVDGQRHFGGDLFSFRHAPVMLELQRGKHVIEVRLVREVRANGGNDHAISVRLKAVISSRRLVVVEDSLLISDVVDGRLAGKHVSFALRNEGSVDIEHITVTSEDVNVHVSSSEAALEGLILPAQTRPIQVLVESEHLTQDTLTFVIRYKEVSETRSLIMQFNLTRRASSEVYKVTHRHPSGIVSYAMVRRPSIKAVAVALRPMMPILVFLHGAGVEASEMADVFDALPDLPAYIVIPAGVTPWSSDDWHTWGFADVEAAVEGLHGLKPTPDIQSWIIAGHSNGGQGTWFTLTHYPDKIIGAAPVSGYTSIQNYVPYSFWRPMDPHRQMILDTSVYNYRHELLAENCNIIEILQQHGDKDDNVPPYHSRLMNTLLAQHDQQPPAVYEIGGNRSMHYFDGIMTTPQLSAFFERKCEEYQSERILYPISQSDRYINFTIVTSNPVETGPKGGIQILYLQSPDRPGVLHATIDKKEGIVEDLVMTTSNVAAFRIYASSSSSPSWWRPYPRKVITVDHWTIVNEDFGPGQYLDLIRVNGQWKPVKSAADSFKRQAHHVGGLHAILRTDRPFVVTHAGGDEAQRIALQTSHNLYQYYKADAAIFEDANPDPDAGANKISLSVGQAIVQPNWSASDMEKFPISIEPVEGGTAKIPIKSIYEDGPTILGGYSHLKMGAIFLRPRGHSDHHTARGGLELVVWGSDAVMLSWASRLIPTVTGVGQPDFIIFSEKMKWQGADSTIMGFFDANWQISRYSATDVRPDSGLRRHVSLKDSD